MSNFINLKLLGDPVNWLTVALMVSIGGFGIALIGKHAENPDTK